ncbi:hypothetical protein K0H71_03470 [Bacillus sp. IITD106]|nr:hypothetical protein [Bacillus sp. IITD106]
MLPISQLLKKTGHQIFTNILTVLGVSAGWSLFLVPVIFILPIHFAIVFFAITIVPVTVSVYAVINHLLQKNKASIVLFIRSFFYYFKRSFFLGILYNLAILIAISEWWYYININNSYLVFLFATFQTYLIFTFLTTQVYAIPFMVIEDLPLFKAMNKSIRYFMKNKGYTVGLFIQIISVTALLSLTVIGFFLLYIGMVAIFVINATNNLRLDKPEKDIIDSRELVNN